MKRLTENQTLLLCLLIAIAGAALSMLPPSSDSPPQTHKETKP